MKYADQIRELQEQYTNDMNMADRLGKTKEGLSYYSSAATVQYQLSKLVEGPAGLRHREEATRLMNLVNAGMKELGIEKKPETTPKPETATKPGTKTEPQTKNGPETENGSGIKMTRNGAGKTDEALKDFDPDVFRFREIPKVTFDDLIGMDESIAQVREIIELRADYKNYSNLADKMPDQSGHAMFFGPPGTGKTHFCKAIANYIMTNYENSAFFMVEAGQIVDKYYGVTPKKLRAIFEEAEKYEFPIIAIDEFEALCPSRGDGDHNDSTRQNVTTLLQLLDGMDGKTNAMVICCTNYPWDVDSAMVSRLKRPVYVDLPTPEAAKQYICDRMGRFLGKDEETRAKMADHALTKLEHASYRNLDRLMEDVSRVSFRKTKAQNPNNYAVAEFVPLTFEEFDELLDQITILYDPAIIARLENYRNGQMDA